MDGRRPPSHSRLWVRAPRRSTALAACVVYGESAQPHEPRFYIVYKSFMVWRARAGPLRHVAGAPRGTPPCIRKPPESRTSPSPNRSMRRGCGEVPHIIFKGPCAASGSPAWGRFPGSDRAAARPTPSSTPDKFGGAWCSVWLARESGFVAPPPSCTPPL